MLTFHQDKQSEPTDPIHPASQSGHKLMLFDLDTRGHHPEHIQRLVDYWCRHDLPGQLDVLVSPKFIQKYSNIVELASQAQQRNVQFISITEQESSNLFDVAQLEYSFKGRVIRAFQEWKLLQKYATSLRTTHCFLMYFDTVFLRMAVGERFPCRFSGIHFRPIVHYHSFPNYTLESREQLWHWRDQICFSRLFKSANLDTLFCFDPFAAEQLNGIYRTSRVASLPDPTPVDLNVELQGEELRERLGIHPGRQVFLLFGALTERKGIHELLEAIQHLPPHLCQNVCLLLVGSIGLQDKDALKAKIARIAADLPVQIICDNEFVAEAVVQSYFQMADVILAPYQRHIGMSGILVRGAAAQKPVLSSDFAVMGEVTRRYKLGLAVDSTVPGEIAKGMSRFLLEPADSLCDRASMKQFAEQNTTEHFCSKIFQCLQSSR